MKLSLSPVTAFVRSFEQHLDHLLNATLETMPEPIELFVFGENSDLVLSVRRGGHIERTFRVTISGDTPTGDFQDFSLQLHWGHGPTEMREDVIQYMGTHFFNTKEDFPVGAGRAAAKICYEWCVLISTGTPTKMRESFDDAAAEAALAGN